MLFLSIHPILILYSHDARPYTLAILLTLSSTYILIKLSNFDFNKTNLIGLYFLLSIMSFFSHYYTIYIFISHFLFVFYKLKFNLEKWSKIIPFFFISLIIIYLWFYFYGFEGLKYINQRNQNYTYMALNNIYPGVTLKTLLGGWIYVIQYAFVGNLYYKNFDFVDSMLCERCLLPVMFISLYVIIFSIKKNLIYKTECKEKVFFLILLTFFSLIFSLILCLISKHILPLTPRYSTFSTPYFVLLLSYGFHQIYLSNKHKFYYPLIFIQIIIMILSILPIYNGFR
jgi:uncharacterized membrane protein